MNAVVTARAADVASKWICCQLGAREHYAVPLALLQRGALDRLITDVWVRPNTWLAYRTNGFSQRFNRGLVDAEVIASNFGALGFEARMRTVRRSGWNLIRARNDWFQDFVLTQLKENEQKPAGAHRTIFAYSYAARRIFQYARDRGWTTVLGQIDPGPLDERLIEKVHSETSERGSKWQRAPAEYWDDWHSECELANHIVVNSTWSRDALVADGINHERIKVIPLGYERAPATLNFRRRYPQEFNEHRPMRVLFLGQVSLRKGAGLLIDAIKAMSDRPIEFWFVGPLQMNVPAELRKNPRVTFFGHVSREQVDKFYQDADVFIFPTLSDGFGLTQLEAQCWNLPVIASTRCGQVVHDGQNGLILEEVSARAITDALLRVLRSPDQLQKMSDHSRVAEQFTLQSLASSLLAL